MATSRKGELTPADCLATLAEPTLDISNLPEREELRRSELRRSILAIAELNHVSESALVRAVVTTVRGELPTMEE